MEHLPTGASAPNGCHRRGGPQTLYSHTLWYNMTKINDDEMRNAFRFRRAPRRTIQKNKIDSGVLEQLTAIKLGLAEDVRA
jgi:hypothetical protein